MHLSDVVFQIFEQKLWKSYINMQMYFSQVEKKKAPLRTLQYRVRPENLEQKHHRKRWKYTKAG